MLEIGPRLRRRHWLPENGASTESGLCRGGTGSSRESDFEPFPRIASESVREREKTIIRRHDILRIHKQQRKQKQKTLNFNRVTVSYAACALHTHTHTHCPFSVVDYAHIYYAWETGFIIELWSELALASTGGRQSIQYSISKRGGNEINMVSAVSCIATSSKVHMLTKARKP